MADFRVLSMIVAAGVVTAGLSTGVAWAGGPGGAVETPDDLFAAVGSGEFVDALVGYSATGPTAEAAANAVIAMCQADGGVECTADEITNDDLCIVSVADNDTDVVAGGAGPTIEEARADAFALAAANGTPFDGNAEVLVSACP